ncbi:oplophorus-luciferin 2-monooxygenase non-catalytic subunit [Hyalella azteca]|uniref:Oplophorus-luciferin 2-monooxygenase non-catalytic subunit n=1 Tax=Hyalella azteca TaxID=294128 RepID=A0A8B7PE71_HYAAZ|nr:oplophorus-luciferin 2-monooxygenase non-catalytic subunit [Hyalella azteca]
MKEILAALCLLSVLVGALGVQKSVPKSVPRSSTAVPICPDAQSILPCRCQLDLAQRLILECVGVQSSDQLAQVFQVDFPEKKFYNLFLDESPDVRVLGDIFNDVSFEIIELYNSGIEFISEYAFIGSLNSLRRLHITSSLLHENTFPFLTINSYPNLTVLDLFTNEISGIPALYSASVEALSIRDTKVTSIKAGTFQGLTQVTSINLEKSFISSLEKRAFWNLPRLQSLSLSENRLTILEAETFQLIDDHMTIYLWNNDISTIQPGAFMLPSTNASFSLFLDLGANQLTQLDEAVFAELFPYFDFLFIASNPLECGCEIAWLIERPEWVAKIGNTAQCADGVRIVDLDPQYYADNC